MPSSVGSSTQPLRAMLARTRPATRGTLGVTTEVVAKQMVPVGDSSLGLTPGLATANIPPQQQPPGAWSGLRETAGSAAVGGPLALPPPPGVKGPTNPHTQVAIPGQLNQL